MDRQDDRIYGTFPSELLLFIVEKIELMIINIFFRSFMGGTFRLGFCTLLCFVSGWVR